jgi:hypothetical protein
MTYGMTQVTHSRFSTAKIIQRQLTATLVNTELERMWKWLWLILSWHLPEGTVRKHRKTVGQTMFWQGQAVFWQG